VYLSELSRSFSAGLIIATVNAIVQIATICTTAFTVGTALGPHVRSCLRDSGFGSLHAYRRKIHPSVMEFMQPVNLSLTVVDAAAAAAAADHDGDE